MTLYLVAGEASGDSHGSGLMSALRLVEPSLRFLGRGGPRMKAVAGDEFNDWSEHSAVLGLWEVLKHYGYFREQFRETIAEVRAAKPNAVVLIDYPGFNLRLARALRSRMPALKIIYYISPQVWAWNRRRIPQMARYLDLMLCIFPFEAELYEQSGLRTIFVGHPMMERLSALRKPQARDPDLIGLFPGSRLREVRKILPLMLQAAERIASARHGTRFKIAAASERLRPEINRIIAGSSVQVGVVAGETASLMQEGQVGIVASGTATLEGAYFGLPFVLVYRVAWLTYLAARLVVKVKHLGMPNVLAGREIVPEFIQHRAQAGTIADAVLQLLNDENARNLMISEFNAIIARLGHQDASATAARAILQEIN